MGTQSVTMMNLQSLPKWIFAALLVLVFCTAGASGEQCPVYSSVYNPYGADWYYTTGYITCGSGCCGAAPDYYCCTRVSVYVGGACGTIFTIIFIVVVVVLIKRSQRNRVQVFTTNNTAIETY